VIAVRDGRVWERSDGLAAEEPLEIPAAGPGQEPVRVAVTMRTPGGDFDLAMGFLVTEGLLAPSDVATVAYCEEPDAQRYNVVTVGTRAPFDLGAAERNFFASSSCGICGKAALEVVAVPCERVSDEVVVDPETLLALPGPLRAGQRVFERTEGLHAAGLFDTSGRLLLLREDVGRHNAVDKVIGALALEGADGAGRILLVSGGRSRSSRRQPSRGCRSSARCPRRPAWPSRRRGPWASRRWASSARAGSTSTPTPSG